MQPIHYIYQHHNTDNLLHEQLTNLHLQHLSEITGLSIKQTTQAEEANLIIIFSKEALLEQEMQQNFNINDPERQHFFSHRSVCLAQIAINTDYSIKRAAIIIPVDRARAHAKLLSCIVEELTQVMGLPNDSEKVFPSIFNDKSYNDLLTGLDYLLLKLLYSPIIKSGMTEEQVVPILDKIIYSTQFQQEIISAEQTALQGPLTELLN